MDFQHTTEGKQGQFYLESEGKKIALIAYQLGADNKIVIEHTEVDASLKGQGVGQKLVQAVVALARSEKVKIMPLCPFAKAYLEKNRSEYGDVLV